MGEIAEMMLDGTMDCETVNDGGRRVVILLRFVRAILSVAAGLGLLMGASGCALRATTDFGPQSETSKRSINAGPEGMPGVSIYGDPGPHPGDVPGGER